MSSVTCYECKKKYDYEEDGFCPRCGAFNLRSRGSYTVADNGDIVRVDGINETGHQNSFVHAEYHAEEQERKKLGLERDERPMRGKTGASASESRGKISGKKQNPLGVIFIGIWLLVVFSMLFSALAEIL